MAESYAKASGNSDGIHTKNADGIFMKMRCYEVVSLGCSRECECEKNSYHSKINLITLDIFDSNIRFNNRY